MGPVQHATAPDFAPVASCPNSHGACAVAQQVAERRTYGERCALGR